MQDRSDAGQFRCRTDHMQLQDGCRTGQMKDRSDTGHEGCRTGLMKGRMYAGQVRCRTGPMQDMVNAGHVGCRTGRMHYRTDAGQEAAGQDGCRADQIQDRMDVL